MNSSQSVFIISGAIVAIALICTLDSCKIKQRSDDKKTTISVESEKK